VEISRRLNEAGDVLKIDGDSLDAELLRSFYQTRQWRPAWGGGLDQLLSILAGADQDGLPLYPLHIAAITSRRQSNGTQQQAEADLLLTDGLLRYADAMRGQRVDPADIEDDWNIALPPFNPLTFLREHLNDMPAALLHLAAPYKGYQLLKQALAQLRQTAAAGDWPKVTPGPTLRPGDQDPRILEIRRRLRASGELSDDGDSLQYDEQLATAVQLFQRRHGLADDGMLGPRSVNALNVSAADRARQAAITMERWRWLPQRMETDHIVVNVPAEQMEVVEKGVAVMTMKVVIGDADHPTPALRARMISLVLNPIWRIPASIASNEILPKLKRDPGYLIANDLELVSDEFPPGSPESQGVGISWQEMTQMKWPVRQRPGSDNALGRIKFNIPNDDDIYLHDTPNHKAFARADRALSHGCVRVERAVDLAVYLMRNQGWTQEKLELEIARGETRTAALSQGLPVWLLYWTMWVDSEGVLQTRDDIYQRDLRLAVALSKANHAVLLPDRSEKIIPKTVNCDGCRIP